MALGSEDNVKKAPPAPGGRPVPKPPVSDRSAFSGLRVSLMPADMEGRQGPDLQRRLLILAFVVILEVIAIGGVNFWLIQSTAKRQAERADLDKRISDIQLVIDEQGKSLAGTVDFDRQIRTVKDSLDQHVHWTEFFRFLESNSRPNVRFLRFSGEADTGVFTVDVLAKSYRDIAEQIVVLRENPSVISVRASSASAKTNQAGEIEGVSTSMMIKVKTDVWSRSEDNIVP